MVLALLWRAISKPTAQVVQVRGLASVCCRMNLKSHHSTVLLVLCINLSPLVTYSCMWVGLSSVWASLSSAGKCPVRRSVMPTDGYWPRPCALYWNVKPTTLHCALHRFASLCLASLHFVSQRIRCGHRDGHLGSLLAVIWSAAFEHLPLQLLLVFIFAPEMRPGSIFVYSCLIS